MGRHSRKGPAAPVNDTGQREAEGPGPGTGRRRRTGGQQPPAAPQPPRPYDSPYDSTYDTPGQGRPYPPQGQGRPYETPDRGTPAHGTPTHGTPAYETPAHGTPRHAGAYETAGRPFVRGGHPAHPETAAPAARYPYAKPSTAGPARPAAPFIPAPRRETPPAQEQPAPAAESKAQAKPGAALGRTLTGIVAAAITTVLAVVIAGQVAESDGDGSRTTHAADDSADRIGAESPASRSDDRAAPSKPPPAAPPTYEQLMARQFPIDPHLKGSGEFETVPGLDKAPGKGRTYRYRVDVEKGLGLDGTLFAQAVQRTLNDRRSWAGKGEMTFERISTGDPDFVITLASPGTTGAWCAKSGLDTTVDNVSCDSASTQRVMINAFRWAQGSVTFGPHAMHAYRQMLINHEVGHRLGHSHVSCRTPGALAPVMQQQTKSLDIDGIKCRPNPWVHPEG
ncbi:DUF3152 domain-containing protein [Streptomyces sp. NPDC101160]|uniref:DUF3152 domain-containing protein n=1 Tax=Streptomyces sp. NPDC101160 TaxID=3366118 RepID=UPI00380EC4E5